LILYNAQPNSRERKLFKPHGKSIPHPQNKNKKIHFAYSFKKIFQFDPTSVGAKYPISCM
jgi:hypothetical protein